MRGLSPIISTLLLLVIGVTVSTIFFYWYTNFQKTLQFKIEEQAERELEQYGYKIEVEEVVCNSSSNKIVIYIRNTGEKIIPSGQAYVYLYDENYTPITSFSVDFLGLNPGQVYVMNISYSGLIKGERYYVKVTVPKYSQGSRGDCEAI